jgi:dipeptidyl aminopeptidase/acylaminoacyl peptidase
MISKNQKFSVLAQFALLFLLLLNSGFSFAQTYLTPEKMWQLKTLSSPQVSPDNKTVVYSVSQMDVKSEKASRGIYYQNLTDNEAKELNTEDLSVSQFFFVPDGRLMLKSGNAFYQLKDLSGKPELLFEADEPLNGVKISNDLSYIAFYKSVKVRPTAQEIYPDLPKTEVMIYKDLMYRHWDKYQDEFARQIFINKFDAENLVASAQNLLEGSQYECPHPPFGGAEDYTFSPDNNFLVYAAKKETGTQAATSTNIDLFFVDLKDGSTQNITETNKGYDLSPKFSPDGRFLAWLQMKTPGYESDKNDLIILDTKTDIKVNITENWNGTLNSFTWSANSKKVYAIAPINGTQQVYEIDFKGKPSAVSPKQLTQGVHNFTSVQEAGKVLLATQTKMNQPTELVTINPKNGSFKQITNVNTEALNQLTFGKVEVEMIPSTDNKEIFTYVIYPPDFDPNKKYPAILYCQGGPQSQISQFFSTRWNFHLMAAAGYIVVAPNRRGLPGFGVEWNEAISTDWGGQPMRDYLSAIDYMANKPFVNEDKLAAVGASYGGYSVYYLAGIHEGRFKAFISHCGLFNLESWYGTTEELFFANHDIGGAYWDNPTPKSYEKFSPHKLAHKWDTPMLVIHGGKDFRVPESEGMQAFQLLQLKNIPSKFLYFPNENHWVLRPQNSILWHREFKNWLNSYLK